MIRTKKGFEFDTNVESILLVMTDIGLPTCKSNSEICIGDRIAIPLGTSTWSNRDPLAGLDIHMRIWQRQFAGKQGPKPRRLINNEDDK